MLPVFFRVVKLTEAECTVGEGGRCRVLDDLRHADSIDGKAWKTLVLLGVKRCC